MAEGTRLPKTPNTRSQSAPSKKENEDQAALQGLMRPGVVPKPEQIMQLQRLLGNRAVTQMLGEQENTVSPAGETLQLNHNGRMLKTVQTSRLQRSQNVFQVDDQTLVAIEPAENEGGIAQTEGGTFAGGDDGGGSPSESGGMIQPDRVLNPSGSVTISAAELGEAGSLQRALTKGKVLKKIGLGAANFLSEAAIGPLTDLKHGIRVLWYNIRKDPEKDKKTKKVRGRVKEEWVGDYGSGNTWMNVLHAISTTVEKIAGIAAVIGLIATILSIWFGAAAPIAAVAAIIGVIGAGISFIIRSILSIASLVKYKKTGNTDMKKMAISNFVSAFASLLSIAGFGISAGISGVSFKAETIAKTDFNRDLSTGIVGSFLGKATSTGAEVMGKRDPNLIRRDPEEGEAPPILDDIVKTINEGGEVLPAARQDAKEEENELSENKNAYGQVSGKLGTLVSDSANMASKAGEAKDGASNVENEMLTPTTEEAGAVTSGDLDELEQAAAVGEQHADSENAPAPPENTKKKKGFFGRVKERAKSLGKSIKRGASKLFGRLSNVFSRFKALMVKLRNKLIALFLSATGLNEKVDVAKEELNVDIQQNEQQTVDVKERDKQLESTEAQYKEVTE